MLYAVIKRVIDILVAILLGILLIPLFVVISILIKLESEGPIIFAQKRCGKDGKEFNMYKFRSMVKDADSIKEQLISHAKGGLPFKIEGDPRITRVGMFLRRTSIDELPQLFNVLKGEMSLVGPRPLSKEEMDGCQQWKEIRLKVKPGITGLWQVKARGRTNIYDWNKYDTEYVMNQSLFLDIKILLMTVGAVIKGRGAY